MRPEIGSLYRLGSIGTARVMERHPRVPGIVFAAINVPGHKFDGKYFMFDNEGRRVDNFVNPLPDLGEKIVEVVERPAF